MESYNVDMGGGPPLHYLIADASGRSVLVEFHRGEVEVIPNEKPWHLATNFLRSAAGESAQGKCWRYDRIYERLAESGGRLAGREALDLLAQVSQENTQWSVVYEMRTGKAMVTMGSDHNKVDSFHLPLAGE